MRDTYTRLRAAKTKADTPQEAEELQNKKDLRLQSAYSLLKDAYLEVQKLQAEIKTLKEKLTQYESPADGYRKDATWVGKIVFILQRAERPLQSKEMIELLEQREPLLRHHHDKQKFFSALLAMPVKHGRVRREKRKGERGYFYSL
ncbi:hypothetical protein [Flavisolibacter ginsenosidimutans]|uniref:Uncharacterized protein n=1 Tax=Flavisolibacter ginsenosidimutans TaxID=661481 RepID=A0A5B8UGX7_9BACT|nr:hypothetical protein [Flavisolibacter ginsenosidimutans]QEC55340.1 hypothetical protein FSB75_05275 [Flavisolibacter ginsenosidimutans]